MKNIHNAKSSKFSSAVAIVHFQLFHYYFDNCHPSATVIWCWTSHTVTDILTHPNVTLFLELFYLRRSTPKYWSTYSHCPSLPQIWEFCVNLRVKMMPLSHVWGWYQPQTTSYINFRHANRGSGPKNINFLSGTYIKSDIPESIDRW